MYRFICAFLALFFVTPCWVKASPQDPLIVYIRDSFYEKWHTLLEKGLPNPVRFIRLPNSALMARLRMEGNDTKAHVVLGIDSCYMAELKELDLVAPSQIDPSLYALPVPWDKDFVPFCYGYIGLLYDTQSVVRPPRTWKEVAALQEKSVVMPNPLTSTVGMVFLEALLQKRLALKITTFQEKLRATPKGLSEAFGLFATGKAPLAVAYTTSAVHRQEQYKNTRLKPLVFKEHPFLAYAAFVTRGGAARTDTKRFLERLVSPAVQQHVYKIDHMYPVTREARIAAGLDQNEPQALVPISNFTAADQKTLAHAWRELTTR
ncbi:MAG: thiamine ABC transporter substrate-binding protein [Alphaproteobacteria bacterium]|nr:thiamine ABC transporter substrate-binding protein [Alphaproteobacteria bacterium]